MIPNCPLCDSNQLQVAVRISAAELASGWDVMGVEARLQEGAVLSLSRCRSCGLEMWQPALAGDGEFYAQLAKLDWYYLSEKWEYDVALKDIRPSDKVLEVGCGRGVFLGWLQGRGIEATGIDTNADAVAQARLAGFDARHGILEDLLPAQAGTFDVVGHFQVLEHVPDPLGFLRACRDLLKPGGRMLVATPNQDSFIKYAPGALLNMPPHHVSRWTEQTHRMAGEVLGMEVQRVEYEPLAQIHAGWAGQCLLNRLLRLGIDDPGFMVRSHSLPIRLSFRFADRAGRLLFRWKAARSMVRGHSIYVAFKKAEAV